MHVPKIYIETSVVNMFFDDHATEKQKYTARFFDEIKNGNFIPYSSAYVIQEIGLAKQEKREKMLRMLDEIHANILQPCDADMHLAEAYVRQNVIPEKYMTDGLHIAIASVNRLDVIFSYNFKHIVKSKTKIMTEIINREHGYDGIVIMSPEEIFQ